MASDYEISLYSPYGRYVANLDHILTASMARAINAVGVLQMSVPVFFGPGGPRGYDLPSYKRDSRIVIKRRPSALYPWRLVGDTIWFVRNIELALDQEGRYQLNIVAYDTLDIIRRRIVAYDATTDYVDKTGEADALIKEVMRENFGELAEDTDRDLSEYLAIAADLPAGSTPSISKEFSRKNVLTVLQELCQASAAEGKWLAFDILALNEGQFQFVTYIQQRGQDRRVPGGASAITLAPEHDNISSIEYQDDYIAEVTFVYAGGTGEGVDRLVETAQDDTRIAASPFNRIEEWRDARNTSDTTALEDEAEALLRQKRPRHIFNATINETSFAMFGVNYYYGDYVTAEFAGMRFDCRIEAFKIDLSDNLGEKIDVKLRVETLADEE